MSGDPEKLPASVRLLRRLYAAGLLAIPGPARRQLAASMLETFEAICLRAHRRGGALPSVWRGLQEVLDVLVAGVRQRLGADPLGPGRRPLRERIRPLADLGTDLRSALRALTRRPAFATVAVLTLASGIAAGTAVFSVVDSVVLRPLPYAQPATLVRLMRVVESGGFVSSWRSEQLEPWLDAGVFSAVSAYRLENRTLIGGPEPERIQVGLVMPNTLDFLGVRPAAGRGFVPEDGEEGAVPVALLESGLARRRFGTPDAAIGRFLEVLGARYRIIGVMPGGFHYPYQATRAWVPRSLATLGKTGTVNVHARRPSAIAEPVLQERGDALAAADANDDLVAWKLWPAGHVDTRLRRWVLVLFGAAGILVLIACANAANLILAQAAQREREVSVRAALGAARLRLVRQSLLESLLLAAAAGGVGSLLAGVLLPWLLRLAPRGITSLTANAVDLDARALGFAISLALATAVLFGLVPALRGTCLGAARALGGSRGAATAASGGRLRGGIIAGEVALTLVLLLGAGLLLGSFARLLAVDLGLELERVVAADLAVPEELYPDLESQLQLTERIVERLRAMDGVAAAAYGLGIPPGFGYLEFGLQLETEAGAVAGIDAELILPWSHVSPEYFDALGIPVLEGRGLEAGEPDDSVVLGSTMAEALWPNGPAAGRRFRLRPDAPWLTVVGVVGDVRSEGPVEPFGSMEMYRPFSGDRPTFLLTLVVRAEGDPAALLPAVRDLVRAAAPDVPIERIATGGQLLADNLREQRFQLALVGVLALLAALLAAFGMFGVISYVVSRRTGELGVRMAVGASPRSVAALVIGSGLRLAAAGVVLGLGLAWMLRRFMRTILFEIEPGNPLVLTAVIAAAFAITLAACLLPALRAARLDPARTLRLE